MIEHVGKVGCSISGGMYPVDGPTGFGSVGMALIRQQGNHMPGSDPMLTASDHHPPLAANTENDDGLGAAIKPFHKMSCGIWKEADIRNHHSHRKRCAEEFFQNRPGQHDHALTAKALAYSLYAPVTLPHMTDPLLGGAFQPTS